MLPGTVARRETEIGGSAGAFGPTLWTLVLRAKARAGDALDRLVAAYWKPAYFHVRRRGADVEDAKDLTQEFFAVFLEKDYLLAADRSKGRFRTFLRVALDRFLSNVRDRDRALKRGGGRARLSLDFASAETEYAREPAARDTPETLFDRAWASSLLERSLKTLEAELGEKRIYFDVLQLYLGLDESESRARQVAERLGLSTAQVEKYLHRARRRLKEIVLREIAPTVSRPRDARDEYRALLSYLA